MDSGERATPLTGRKLRDRKGAVHTWTLSVPFTTLRGGWGGFSSKSLAVKGSHVRKHHLLGHIPKRRISAHLFEDFPFA